MDKIGFALPDFIRTEKIRKRNHHDDSSNRYDAPTFRNYIFVFVLIFLPSILLIRLVYLQLFNGSYYRGLSNSNRIRTTIIHAPRGIIFDRNKTPLVFNIPGYRKQEKDTIVFLSQEEAIKKLAKGERLDIDSLRQYPFADAFSHVIGFIGQVSKEELATREFASYSSGDTVGKMGIEKQYEDKLAGTSGKKLVEVDSNGKTIRTLGQSDPIPGEDITLTLDAKLQQKAYESLSETEKAVVIISNPKGEILALVSKPAFDPNLFTLGQSYKTATNSAYSSVSSILQDLENQPMLNRAISGVYPPGSTFKLVTATAGLEDGIIDQSYIVKDTGVLKIGEFSFANWYFTQYGGTDGDVDVIKGIGRSNDIFFYKLAEKVGVDHLSSWAGTLGVGKKTGIDLEGETDGLLPSSKWKKEVMNEQWYLGDTYHFGIGQGFLLTTPLQVNMWTQAFANGGVLYQPHLLKNLKSRTSSFKLKDETNRLIREGMELACNKEGVAWPLFDFKVRNAKLKIDNKNFYSVSASDSASLKEVNDYRHVSIACKTGTAQHGGEETLPHAWITLFAPSYNPEIVVTVLVESSGEGSTVAAPIAKKVLEEWFTR